MTQVERDVFADAAMRRRYDVVARIGGGAYSSVYEAAQRSTGQRVAVKVLRALDDGDGVASQRDADRFRREMELCARLHHPNIVRLIDSGEAGGLLFAVFELVPGQDLAEVLAREGGLDPAEAVHLMTQVLDALSCAHASGIVHRDLKPANIMITSTGARRNALVLDFGLGVSAVDVAHGGGSRLTVEGEYLGTPQYSAPEQLRGALPTVRSDIYAWGLTFIECLTGVPAVSGRTPAEVVHAQLGLQPVALPRAIALHPLGRLLRAATAKQPPGARGSAEDLLRELQHLPLGALPGRAELVRPGGEAGGADAAAAVDDVVWRVPLQRNQTFTGRRALLDTLRAVLATEPPPPVVALCGLGGIGKTQIALEYAHRAAAEYELVAWLRAEDADTLAGDYAALAECLGLPEKATRDQQARVDAVRHWLERHRRWLLVFDNAPSPQTIRAYLPSSPSGHVLATSRHQGWRSIGTGLAIDVLEPDEAAQFLATRTGDAHTPDAERLCEDLGRLPLALEEAAAYIEATGRSIATYRRLLESNRRRLFDAGTPPADYPWTVRSTWEISLQRLEAEAPHALQFLCLCAYLAPDDIPLAELRAGMARLEDGPLAPLADEIQFDRCMAALRRYSLVKLGESAVSLHRLVQLVARDRLAPSERARWAALALELVEAVYPLSGLAGDVRPESGRLLPHALAALAHTAPLPACEARAAHLLSRTGVYLSATGVPGRAIEHLKQALDIFERRPELGDRERAALLANVGVVQHARGELDEARVFLERALALHERLDGPDALTVGLDLVTLAWVRRVLGDLDAARAAGERGARIVGATLGASHPIVATLRAVTARVQWERGEIDAARRLLDEVLSMLDRARSDAFHPMTAGAWFQAGLVALELGDVARALACAARGADVGAPAYGPDHPLVLSNLVVSAQALLERDDLAGARRALERVVHGSARTCPRPHADLAQSLPLLAEVYRRDGDPALARRTAEQVRDVAAAVAGDRTRLLAGAHRVLGNAAADLGDLARARCEHDAARELLEARMGPTHPALLPVLNAQARLHLRTGAYEHVQAACVRALAIAASARLDRHLETAAALEMLAEALRVRGRRPEALERLTAAAAIVVQRLGATSERARRLVAQAQRLRDA